MFHCPKENLQSHQPPSRRYFVMTALIRVDPHCKLQEVQDHFLDVVVCGICGADAEDLED